MSSPTVSLPLPAVVDALADVQVQIAVLEAREKELKKALVDSGLKEVCGSTVRAVISTSGPVISVAWKDLALALNPSPKLLLQHSAKKAPVSSVRLYGYN